MIRHRQPVQRQHPEDRRQRGEEHRKLERDRNEGGPAMERTSTDIQRDNRSPRRKYWSPNPEAADNAPESSTSIGRYGPRAGTRSSSASTGNGRIRVEVLVSRVAALGGFHKLFGRVELRHQAIDGKSLCRFIACRSCGNSLSAWHRTRRFFTECFLPVLSVRLLLRATAPASRRW